jgi:hypothetical protein
MNLWVGVKGELDWSSSMGANQGRLDEPTGRLGVASLPDQARKKIKFGVPVFIIKPETQSCQYKENWKSWHLQLKTCKNPECV